MLLSFSNVRLGYAGATVLDIPRLDLPAGFYELHGPNGSGKTTLLKAIAGMLPLAPARGAIATASPGATGAIALCGLDSLRDRVAYRRICGFAEAEPVYPEFLSGIELYAFYAKVKGGEGPYAPVLRSALGLDAFMARRTSTYSSGMLKKLSLVLAWVGNPQLVLLDEPLVTLDAGAIVAVESFLGSSPVSLIVTSHQPWGLTPKRLMILEGALHV